MRTDLPVVVAANAYAAFFGSERPPIASGESSCVSREEIAAVEIVRRTENIAFFEPVGSRRSGGPLLKLKEAANYLAISTRQLQYLSKRGKVAVISVGKTGVRWDREDLDAFICRCRRTGRAVQSEVTYG